MRAVVLLPLLLCACGQQKQEKAEVPSSEVKSYIAELPTVTPPEPDRSDCKQVRAAFAHRSPKLQPTSTYDRIKGEQEARQEQSSDVHRVYAAYRCGIMSKKDMAKFEYEARFGSLVMMKFVLNSKPSAPLVPKNVVDAYNSGILDEQAKDKLLAALKNGDRAMPPGEGL